MEETKKTEEVKTEPAPTPTKMPDIIIYKGNIMLQLNRTELHSVDQTHDGVVFKLSEGLHLYLTDQYMPNTTKDLIKAASNFSKGRVEFDLANYNRPAEVKFD